MTDASLAYAVAGVLLSVGAVCGVAIWLRCRVVRRLHTQTTDILIALAPAAKGEQEVRG